MLLPYLELDKKQREIKKQLRISRAMYKCLRLEVIAITPRTEKEAVRPCNICSAESLKAQEALI